MSHFRLRRAALRFADQGWSVTPGAWLEPAGDDVPLRFECGRPGCVTSSCHPALTHWDDDATTDAAQIEEWWQDAPYSLLLATGHGIEVIEVPALLGARAVCGPVTGPGRPSATGALRGPVAVTPQDRWMFFVRTDEGEAGPAISPKAQALRLELARREDVLFHTRESWVPLPPTRLRTGPVRWEVSPDDVEWRMPTNDQMQQALVAAMVALDASLLESRHARTVTPAARPPAAVFPLPARRTPRTRPDISMEVLRRAA
ncbi:MAG: DNA primase [Hamadaea sp.]|nr:DNA primase [Hamadaea sp.]